MLRRLLPLFLTAMLFIATDLKAENLVLNFQGGSNQSIPLNTLQKITFSTNNLVLNFVTGGTQSYAFSNLAKMFFGTDTYIENTSYSKADIFFNPSDNQLNLRNLTEGKNKVAIYRIDGVAVLSTTITNNESIDMSGYPAGIYLIRINTQVLKFKK